MICDTAAPRDNGVERLRAIGCDEFELGLLPVLRHLLTGLIESDPRACKRAYDIACERWGEAIGLSTAYSLTKLTTALVDCREGRFPLCNPLCPDEKSRITDEELQLVAMLHHMRRDNTAAARTAVIGVTAGRMDPYVIRAGLAFADRFSAGAGRRCGVSDRPRLSIVA